MQFSVRTDSEHSCGNVKMKTNYKNPYKKDPSLQNIVEQVATRLQHIKERDRSIPAGMPTCSIEHAEAVRRYYAAFPALSKGEDSPPHYYLPPPSWCRKTATETNMQSEPKDYNSRIKKFPTGKERRNSYHGQRKNRKRCATYSRSLESKPLPEWMTHEGSWDMASQDPVREFIRAIALDEGYGTCENTLAEEEPRAVPEWPAGPEPDPDPELYARFEAKFDRSLEALWARDRGDTPDDDYQELPADLCSLLASPADRLGGGVWAAPAPAPPPSPPLHDRLRPLHLASPRPDPPELHSFALYAGDDLFDALATVADTVRSLTAINHSRDTSGFAEVPPRRRPAPPPPPAPLAAPAPPDPEDLLTSSRTHFRPIRREADAAPRYADGDTFDISGELEPVAFRRSPAGGAYLGAERYLEYRAEERERGIDYGRLALTAAQRAAEAAPALPLRFAVRQRDAAAQTDGWAACDECAGAAKKMRPDAGIWSGGACRACAATPPAAAAAVAPDELSRDWEELLADISAAHAQYSAEPGAWGEPPADRKRRHSAALRCARQCTHPHARFLSCCALDRPLTR